MPTRKTFLRKTGKLAAKLPRSKDTPKPARGPALTKYKHTLLNFFDKSKTEIEKEHSLLQQRLKGRLSPEKKKELEWRLTGLQYIENAREGKEPASNLAKFLTIVNRYDKINYDTIEKFIGVPHYLTEKWSQLIRKDPSAPKELIEKLKKIGKKSESLTSARAGSLKKRKVIELIQSHKGLRLRDVYTDLNMHPETLEKWLLEWTIGPQPISDEGLRKEMEKILSTKGKSKKGTRRYFDARPYALNALLAYHNKPISTVESKIQELKNQVNAVKGKRKIILSGHIRGLKDLSAAKTGNAGASRTAKILHFLSQYTKGTPRLMSKKLDIPLLAVQKKLSQLKKNRSTSKPLKKQIKAYQKRGVNTSHALRSGLKRRKVLKTIMASEPRSTRELARLSGVGKSPTIINYLREWTEGPYKLSDAKEGTGKYIEKQVRRLRDRHSRDPTYLFTDKDKWRLIRSEGVQQIIERGVNWLPVRARNGAEKSVEAFLFKELDYLPSIEDLDWYLGTRIQFGLLIHRTDARKYTQESRRTISQQLEEEMKLSPVEREVLKLLAEEEAEKKKKKG